jgi:hypothetical protein
MHPRLHRAVPRAALLVPGAALALACSEGLAPGSVLVGEWSSADASVVATSSQTTLAIPCIAVRFAAIRLDDSLAFQATGVVTEAGGLVTVRPGDSYRVAGRVLGNRLVLAWPWTVGNSGQDTLTPGGPRVHVCNA